MRPVELYQTDQQKHFGNNRKGVTKKGRENICRNNGCKVPKFDDIGKFKHPSNSMKPK